MLTIVDNEEFYEQEKPLSLKDIKCLIVILRQVIFVGVKSSGQRTSQKIAPHYWIVLSRTFRSAHIMSM